MHGHDLGREKDGEIIHTICPEGVDIIQAAGLVMRRGVVPG